MIRQCAILFGCLALGELIVFLTDIKLPSSIIGMLLLLLLLLAGVVRTEHIREKSDYLLGNLPFFFIPAGVSILNYVDVLRENLAAQQISLTEEELWQLRTMPQVGWSGEHPDRERVRI